jgi:hypothetical protein
MKRMLQLLVLGLVVVLGAACPKGQVRPPGNDGSARWAADIAQPKITAFASDAQIRTIAGARIAPDGRVFANTGSWAITAFSPSRQEKLEVIVSADGTTSESTSAATGAGIQAPLPANWINSTDVFTRVRTLVPAFDEATLVTFNLTDFGGEFAGKATWAVNTPGGNVLVMFDGSAARKQ